MPVAATLSAVSTRSSDVTYTSILPLLGRVPRPLWRLRSPSLLPFLRPVAAATVSLAEQDAVEPLASKGRVFVATRLAV